MNERILLVEDETVTRFAIKESLIKNGFKVEDRSDTKDALRFVDAGGLFDAAILDIHLPDNHVGGIEIAERISDKYSQRRKPVIFLTNHSDHRKTVLEKNLADNFFQKQKFIDNDYQEVIDYIRFPMKREEILPNAGIIKFYYQKENHYLPLQSIICIKADQDDIYITAVDHYYKNVVKRLSELVEKQIMPLSLPDNDLINIDFYYRRRPGFLINVNKVTSFTDDTFTFIKKDQSTTIVEKGVGKMINDFYEMKRAFTNKQI